MPRVAPRVDGVRAQEAVDCPMAGKFTGWFFEGGGSSKNVVAKGAFGVGNAADAAMNTAGNGSSQTGLL